MPRHIPARSLILGAALLCGAALAAAPAQAQRTQPAPGWSFELTLYGWATGVEGTLNTPSARVGDPSFSADFNDILGNLTGAFMGSAELRYDRFGLVGDLIVANVKQNIDTRDVAFNGGTGKLDTTAVGVFGLYRVIDLPEQWLDLGVGFQALSMDASLNLNAGRRPAAGSSASSSFVDPALAARYRYRFNDAWSVTAFGTIGGFGVGSQLSWQLMGTVDWRVASWVDLRAGWRYYAIDYDGTGGKVQFDGALSGPIIGATFRF